MQIIRRCSGCSNADTTIQGHDCEWKRQPGLSDVVSTFLGVPLDKREQCSNWERRPLSRLQLIYAALDAVVLLDLLHAMYLSYNSRRVDFV